MMPWDAAHFFDYGYSYMTIINSTHVKWQQISDEVSSKCFLNTSCNNWIVSSTQK